MLRCFHQKWSELPTVWLDTETTGVVPGADGVVQFGIARFSAGGRFVDSESWLVNPGRPIPASATEIHGITDEMVRDAPPLAEVLALPRVRELLDGAQPGAYNATFDAPMLPGLFDRDWPWLDSLTLVRLVDRYAKGKGRHKLATVCARHGIALGEHAHDAGADARAAGELFYKLAPGVRDMPGQLGNALRWFEIQRTEEWHRFNDWRARQPPQQETA